MSTQDRLYRQLPRLQATILSKVDKITSDIKTNKAGTDSL